MDDAFLSSEDAAHVLGISRASLYAYVSRGLLQSLEAAPGSRRRLYRRDEVLRLRESRRRARDRQATAESALSWGAPLLESALTLIGDGKLYYRGRDVSKLVYTHRFEEVAQLLWTGRTDGELFSQGALEPALEPALVELLRELPPVSRLQVVLPLVANDDLSAYDPRPVSIHRSGVRILGVAGRLATLDCRAPGRASTEQSSQAVAGAPPLARRLQHAWCPDVPAAAEALDSVLILCADHELNVSSFAARVVASAHATPYDAVLAGLAALRGTRHGAGSLRAERLLRELWRADQVERAVLRRELGQRLRVGERLAGFGHRLYPTGDPRYSLIASRLEEVLGDSPVLAFAGRLTSVMTELVDQPPNLDLGLGLAALALDLPAGSSLTLFALGRIAGWIGHTAEQAQRVDLIRPRARYTGPVPQGV